MTTPPWCREKVMVYYMLEFIHKKNSQIAELALMINACDLTLINFAMYSIVINFAYKVSKIPLCIVCHLFFASLSPI